MFHHQPTSSPQSIRMSVSYHQTLDERWWLKSGVLLRRSRLVRSLPRQPVWREHFQLGKEIGAADTGDVDPGILQCARSALSPASKKLIPCTVFSSTLCGLVRRSKARTPAEKSSSADR